MMTINEWPLAERPREKLLHHGADRLSEAELVAILLRTGVNGKSALDLSRELLLRFGGLRALLDATPEKLCEIRGIGAAKSVQLQAALELARRYLHHSVKKCEAIEKPSQLKQLLQLSLCAKEREVLLALFLNNGHHIIAQEEVFQGTLRSVDVHPRELLRRALKHNAAALIIAHNHPAGNPIPSEADWALTRELESVLALCEIKLLDHFIVGDNEVRSLREMGWV